MICLLTAENTFPAIYACFVFFVFFVAIHVPTT